MNTPVQRSARKSPQGLLQQEAARIAQFTLRRIQPRLKNLPIRTPFYKGINNLWVATGRWRVKVEVTPYFLSLTLTHIFSNGGANEECFSDAPPQIPPGFSTQFRLPFIHTIEEALIPGTRAEWAAESTPNRGVRPELILLLADIFRHDLSALPDFELEPE